ncbi:MAG TPA: hypothetical protein VLM38_06830 [Blastocatellia bacterium]|nr:hypothetical protein [Blastocatellia bacterium]
MGRIILILTAACLLATFMIISNSSFKVATNTSPKNDNVTKKAEKDRPMKRERDSRARIPKRGAVNRSQPSNVSSPIERSVEAGVTPGEENNEDAAHAIVKGDNTPVYSVNSRDSSVVKRLRKGDKVATDVEVTDIQGRWTIVKKADLTRPGFVLGENLQRPAAKKTENKK